MSDEQRRILEMVADGTLSQEDADRLLEVLGPGPEAPAEEAPADDLADHITAAVDNIVDKAVDGAHRGGMDLGDRISSAVEAIVDKAMNMADRTIAEQDTAPMDADPQTSLLALAGDTEGDGVHSLVISWVDGQVELVPWEGSELRVTETANRPMREDEQMSQTLENGVLTVEWTRKRRRIGPLNLRKRLVVEIPAGVALRRVEVNSVSAPVRLEGTAAALELTVSTVSGKLEAFDLAAPALKLTTVSGKLELQGFAGDTVSLNTVSGKLTAHGAARVLETETVSGKLVLSLEDLPENLRANSVSGKIDTTLVLPPEDPRGFTVSYESLSGLFESDFPLTGELKKHHGTGVYGDGSHRISMETTSGKMELHRFSSL